MEKSLVQLQPANLNALAVSQRGTQSSAQATKPTRGAGFVFEQLPEVSFLGSLSLLFFFANTFLLSCNGRSDLGVVEDILLQQINQNSFKAAKAPCADSACNLCLWT